MSNCINIGDMTLNDLAPYILGKCFTGEDPHIVRGNPDILQCFVDMLNANPIAKEFFNSYEVHNNFFETMPDFAHAIPKELQAECFYATKNGEDGSGVMCYEIPAICTYVLRKAWAECDGIPNMILKVIPMSVLCQMLQQNYFMGGLTLRDVICTTCSPDYNPLSFKHLKNKVGDFTEIYVASTDMVAVVPNAIADCLDDDGISRIEVTPNGLASNGILLRTMANYVGAINSIYDLRELI